MGAYGSGPFGSGPFGGDQGQGGGGGGGTGSGGIIPGAVTIRKASPTILVRRLDENHDMTFGAGLANFAIDAEGCAQNVRTRLQTIQGEWFLDVSAGIPYLNNTYVPKAITDKPADLAFAEASIREETLGTDGVQDLLSFASQFDRSARVFSAQVALTTEFGTTENIKVIYE